MVQLGAPVHTWAWTMIMMMQKTSETPFKSRSWWFFTLVSLMETGHYLRLYFYDSLYGWIFGYSFEGNASISKAEVRAQVPTCYERHALVFVVLPAQTEGTSWVLFVAVCKDSYVIYTCGFNWVRIWLGFIESLVNHVINNDVMSFSQKWPHTETTVFVNE